jgi:hypothetical protein
MHLKRKTNWKVFRNALGWKRGCLPARLLNPWTAIGGRAHLRKNVQGAGDHQADDLPICRAGREDSGVWEEGSEGVVVFG